MIEVDIIIAALARYRFSLSSEKETQIEVADAFERAGIAAEREVRVAIETLETLQPAARERGISVPELVQKLLDTVAGEKMVTAVLDDEAELRTRKERRR